jgi:hypothetical protein
MNAFDSLFALAMVAAFGTEAWPRPTADLDIKFRCLYPCIENFTHVYNSPHHRLHFFRLTQSPAFLSSLK